MTTIDVNGDTLYFRDHPPGTEAVSALPLVWLHGFSFNAELYEAAIALLPGHRHIAIDMRGHGRSAQADTDMTFERIVSDVHAIVSGLGIDRFVMVGHSLGNAVGLRVAATYPDMVAAGVAIAGVPAIGMPMAARAGLAAIQDTAGEVDAFLTTFTALFRHPGHDELIRSAARSAAGMTAAGLALAASEPMRDNSDVLVAAVTQPWLFLVPGADDAVPSSLQRAGAELFAHGTIIDIPDEGHALAQERPEVVAQHIGTFLADLVTAPTA
ncbi:alpha/beta fold hydrolase [Nocardia sp. R6R-6]|uniref:alpha/beta fold hydrolase n=1 Tax=Nocardia sp. R6R-6 TaxID=3459303 RepID=UPI00403D9332